MVALATRYLRLALTSFMAIWLSGVALLLCCHVQPADAADFCPLAKFGGHCDKANKEKSTEKATNPSDEQGFDCCAFIPSFFDKTRTFDNGRIVASVAPAIVEPPSPPTRIISVPAYAYQPTVLLKNNSFLRNRTLRI